MPHYIPRSGNSLLLALMLGSTSTWAADILVQRTIGMELARDVVNEAVLACRKAGYQVSAVVVDKDASLRAALRDDAAPRFTLDISQRKANMVIMGGTESGAVVENRSDIRNELNQIDGLIMLKGGLPIIVGGYLAGAVGVSGAPGGDKDESCARAALEALEDRIAFSD
ncbi:uncharacterized protein GlcG (DUF336 family) [Thiogranum longum]|uniref:Uncharacterized protein GlcG (DUF336 family) n=1 Tax=Thiogranum longum TaxID=1537524 RepID=A0A4R1HDR1_9GAMM|nr:heme-binding protein [Thiogranum longum]TCK17439.1 uncharacterized protein GlcG (DUF336 family) [Thiogranum longum]